MKLHGVLFLAAFTPRSQAYAQAMAKADLYPEHVLFYGSSDGVLPGQSNKITSSDSGEQSFYPDFSEKLEKTAEKNSWDCKTLSASHINEQAIFDELSNIKPKLVIYSGYGSQIVKPELLNLASFLHIHSGWLPEYRGSTTLYYSWLKEGYCGVSAILLRKSIDTGPIIARKKYPPPPPGVDPDYVYDSAIRSDLLIDVIQEHSRHNKFDNLLNQPLVGNNYYVIHPVLKHIALLKNESMHS
tara:strand:- start:271 stop:996 length:726 start_codon:yes stop_codon:yes gene_type:complete